MTLSLGCADINRYYNWFLQYHELLNYLDLCRMHVIDVSGLRTHRCVDIVVNGCAEVGRSGRLQLRPSRAP